MDVTDPYRRVTSRRQFSGAIFGGGSVTQLRLTGENRGVCGSGWAVGMLQATAGQREPSPGQRRGGLGPSRVDVTDPYRRVTTEDHQPQAVLGWPSAAQLRLTGGTQRVRGSG